MESLILAMTAVAPWAFGSVHPASMLLLNLGLAATLALWSFDLVFSRRSAPGFCPVLLCLCGAVLLGIAQLAPLHSATLRVVSPSTAVMRSELYPSELESIDGAVAPAPSSTISLDPGATKTAVAQFLGLILVFALTRFALASPAALRRLAIVCVVNGTLLSLFALAQRFSAPPELMYWCWPVQGSCYGPFVCRNHFPDYVNVCVFLGAGLLLDRPACRQRVLSPGMRLAELLHDPAGLWLTFALAVMVTGVLFSYSRGGMMALAAASLCGMLLMRSSRFGAAFGIFALVGALAVGMASWFGADAIEQRLGSLVESAPDAGRSGVWLRTLPLIGRFPLFGAGLGVFYSVEPQTRQPGDPQLPNWEHAHNDYLEFLVEGGVVHFALLMLAVGCVYRSGFRSLEKLRRTPFASLGVGALCGCTAVLLHSAGDFGLHIPAVALLLAVLAGQIVGLADPPQSPLARQPGFRVALFAAACVFLACMLPFDAWLRERADYYRRAAVRAADRLPPGQRAAVVEYLEAAARFAPDDALIHLRLAEVRYQEYQARLKAATYTPESLDKDDLHPALWDYLVLRSLNPLYELSHARLAAHRDALSGADSAERYLERATRLRPTDATLWYNRGVNRLRHGEYEHAWQDWRRSLTCSRAHLTEIAQATLARGGPTTLVECVLPPNPQLMLEVAQADSILDSPEARRTFAERALARLPESARVVGDDSYIRAHFLGLAGRKPEAIAALDAVLLRRPDMVDWRLEFAQLLVEAKEWKAAEVELKRILRDRPEMAAARELNLAVLRARAGGQ
jgi:O-antigen ligase/tetratricopeptide (TPR) repeat protein